MLESFQIIEQKKLFIKNMALSPIILILRMFSI